MKAPHLWLAAVLMSAFCAAISTSAEEESMTQQTSTATVGWPAESKLASLDQAQAWLNSKPLKPADLAGRVVLIDFWTYTCINWRRTAPYLRTWAQKYKDQGLVIVGVHTPEFSFEKDVENVRVVSQAQDIDYPIAIDSDFAIWRAFENHYWPAVYLIDARGRVRGHRFGEGEYEQLELTIRKLLAEAGRGAARSEPASVDGHGAEAEADWKNLKSPETYVGYGLAQNFASPGGAGSDRPRLYAAPESLKLNAWALSGDWTMRKEAAALNKASGRILYRFHARDLHLVMAPATRGTAVRFRVLIDGHPPGASHGVDIDRDGMGTVVEPRMYQLIRQQGPIEDRRFEIEFLDAGVEVFVFTFG